LLQAALSYGLPITSADALVLREAELPTGVPDLIAVEPRQSSRTPTSKRPQLRLYHFQILHFLNDCGPRSLEDIARLLNLPYKKTKQVLGDLEAASLVAVRRERFVPCSNAFRAKRIVAIEVKMRAWREALKQATANLWFASHSYILVPALGCLRTICHEARKFGIGVLVFDGKVTRTALPARKQRIPVSYGSWLINEWALAQCDELKI
jgi:DNA-binding MarR family transcriptional regulator